MRKYFSIFLIIVGTIVMLYFIVLWIGVKGFLFAWILNFMLMMCVYFFTETLKAPLQTDYYREKKWEEKGKTYERLGINLFRKLLVILGWEKLNKKDNPVAKNLKALMHLEYRTRQSELGHLIIFIIVMGFNIYVAIQYGIVESLWLLVLNIFLNLYPIFLQRYNRPRLQRVIALGKRKKKKNHLPD
jgi:Glycosyl-4,4'-diaponeurosporenoate acyltransferase